MTFSEQINDAAELLQRARYTVAFTGAGISTPSGIPDFRSHNSGLWENVDPLAVASLYGFRQNPQAFYNWIYPLARLTLNAQPNPAHIALAASCQELGLNAEAFAYAERAVHLAPTIAQPHLAKASVLLAS